MCYSLGIDVGETCTDVVIMDPNRNLLAAAKAPTTADVRSGIDAAVGEAITLSGIDVRDLKYVMVGISACLDWMLRRSLVRTGVLRVSRPAGSGILPMETWPATMRAAVGDCWRIIAGGYEYDGRLLAPLDLSEVSCALLDFQRAGIQALAVAGVFATVEPEQELAVAAAARKLFGPSFPITLSHEVGRTGLVERENAAIVNAALTGAIGELASKIEHTLAGRGIVARLFLAQNNGTLMSLAYALRYPIFTAGSGAANSARGAAFLSGLTDCVVVDVGGSTTSVVLLLDGYPRDCTAAVSLGGISVNVRMPEVISLPVGGERLVDVLDGGGQDIRLFLNHLEDAVERIRSGLDHLPVVLVGGGSANLPDRLAGASTLLRPRHAYCAGAVGVATAAVSGEVDRVWSLERFSRAEILARAGVMARERAQLAGADPGTIQILDVEESPLTYLPSKVIRVKAKAVGGLAS